MPFNHYCAVQAAMVGFFMAYFIDSLTSVGLVDQMENLFCKTLLFVVVAGVLLRRKNEDVDNLKKLLDETTFYDNHEKKDVERKVGSTGGGERRRWWLGGGGNSEISDGAIDKKSKNLLSKSAYKEMADLQEELRVVKNDSFAPKVTSEGNSDDVESQLSTKHLTMWLLV
ncbi:hypothetical protein Tco_1449746 [Tanacetum coccineum]